jgi:hypothetical protein
MPAAAHEVCCGERRAKMTNKTVTTMRRFAFCAMPVVLVSSLATAPARAQDATVPAQVQSQAQTQASFSEAQIEQFVAPIALYPDPLLTQILMASTYPLEVVEAARWSRDNPAVNGPALQDAMQAGGNSCAPVCRPSDRNGAPWAADFTVAAAVVTGSDQSNQSPDGQTTIEVVPCT